MKFVIKDGPRCPGVDAIVKRLMAGEVLPPMPSLPPKLLDLRFIDKLTREECQTVHERVQARGRQLRKEDPLVYGVKRIWKDSVSYNTQVGGLGWRQVLATDLEHSELWLTTLRRVAEEKAAAMQKESPAHRSGMVWEVFEIPKTDAIKLPCYRYYKQFEEFTGGLE